CSVLLPRSGALRALPSFPTRRSSDLIARRRGIGREAEPIQPGRVEERARQRRQRERGGPRQQQRRGRQPEKGQSQHARQGDAVRSEEHTSELQSRENLVCRLLLEKKK